MASTETINEQPARAPGANGSNTLIHLDGVTKVFLTDEVEPAIKTMRAAAAEVRRDALSGLSSAQQDQFVDALLAIKGNLSKQDNGANGDGAKKRKR